MVDQYIAMTTVFVLSRSGCCQDIFSLTGPYVLRVFVVGVVIGVGVSSCLPGPVPELAFVTSIFGAVRARRQAHRRHYLTEDLSTTESLSLPPHRVLAFVSPLTARQFARSTAARTSLVACPDSASLITRET